MLTIAEGGFGASPALITSEGCLVQVNLFYQNRKRLCKKLCGKYPLVEALFFQSLIHLFSTPARRF